jgi:hypothetical protein
MHSHGQLKAGEGLNNLSAGSSLLYRSQHFIAIVPICSIIRNPSFKKKKGEGEDKLALLVKYSSLSLINSLINMVL